MRIQFEIKESLANILDQLTHSDFWATEIKEDESGKKIIKIKDLAYNLEAVAAGTRQAWQRRQGFYRYLNVAALPCSIIPTPPDDEQSPGIFHLQEDFE